MNNDTGTAIYSDETPIFPSEAAICGGRGFVILGEMRKFAVACGAAQPESPEEGAMTGLGADNREAGESPALSRNCELLLAMTRSH